MSIGKSVLSGRAQGFVYPVSRNRRRRGLSGLIEMDSGQLTARIHVYNDISRNVSNGF
jgi:hypothetical protein